MGILPKLEKASNPLIFRYFIIFSRSAPKNLPHEAIILVIKGNNFWQKIKIIGVSTMSIINKYPLENWVLSQDNLKIGDSIAFFDENAQQEVIATVLGFPSTDLKQYLSCKRAGAPFTEVINFYDNVVYRVDKPANQVELKYDVKIGECSCGAKFTSNPKYHLSYCDQAIA